MVIVGHGARADERHADGIRTSRTKTMRIDPRGVLVFASRPYYPAHYDRRRVHALDRGAKSQTSTRGIPTMASDKPIRVAIIGLGFGAEFIPIYQNHPDAEMYAICRRDQAGLDEVRRPVRHQGPLHRLSRTCSRTRKSTPSTSTRRSPTTPGMSIAALKAGKHVACTVPMATIDRGVQAGRRGPARPAARST